MRDYKNTLLLPQTNFSLQGGAPEDKFIEHESNYTPYNGTTLHDGPPYANGNIHIGHAVNKILKDILCRADSPVYGGFHPGWDCHGLPIEWQVERNLIAEGESKNDLSPLEFRQLCREYAQKWVMIQREQFKALGVRASWNRPYLTMDFSSEATIIKTIQQIAKNDLLYRGTKPVLWSVVEETALAEAEVEHHDLKSSQVWVRFPIAGPVFAEGDDVGGLLDCSVPIWTTTPWTLPANLAIAYNSKFSYGLYKVVDVFVGSECVELENFLLADARAEDFAKEIGVKLERAGNVQPLQYFPYHPFSSETDSDDGWSDRERWGETFILHSDHVTEDVGTGFVHIAPEHGPEDFVCWNKATNNQPFDNVVNADGAYVDDMPMFGGMKVLQQTPKGDYIFEFCNAKIIAELDRRGCLLKTVKAVHPYPHSWRSKAPLIYRCTPQWFLRVSAIRAATLTELETVSFTPEHGKNRFRAAMESRPDWLISRQRVWGTPMAFLVHKGTQAILHHPYMERRMASVFEAEGGDAWWKYDVAFWLSGTGYNPDDYEKVTDVLDVWFDSGCSHLFDVDWGNEHRKNIYMEGSDQHRGWFGSSMLVNMAVYGNAPFNQVITHGFVLDDMSNKMSKSAKNGLSPQAISEKYGTDVLRLWVAMTDYTQDIKINDQVLKTASEIYRRFRNTLRYLVGNTGELDTNYWTVEDFKKYKLEKRIIARTNAVFDKVNALYRQHNFKEVCALLMDYCVNDLSSFYFDIKKDTLYCEAPDSEKRKICVDTLQYILMRVKNMLKPLIPFAIFEIDEETHKRPQLCFERFIDVNSDGEPIVDFTRIVLTEEEKAQWDGVDCMIDAANLALEHARKEKLIGSSLEAKAHVFIQKDCFEGLDVAEILRVSQAVVVFTDLPTGSVAISKAVGEKCARSWKVGLDVGSDSRYPDLSARDADVVAKFDNHMAKWSKA
jgi:isoleucyl-tRNA synthetase